MSSSKKSCSLNWWNKTSWKILLTHVCCKFEAGSLFPFHSFARGFHLSHFSRKQDRCSNLCARLVYHDAQSLHSVTWQAHTILYTAHLHTLHAHTQSKLFISLSYEMQLLFLSPSLSLSGGIHMDKRRGKWVFRAPITSSQGGNNNNNVLYEALCTPYSSNNICISSIWEPLIGAIW